MFSLFDFIRRKKNSRKQTQYLSRKPGTQLPETKEWTCPCCSAHNPMNAPCCRACGHSTDDFR